MVVELPPSLEKTRKNATTPVTGVGTDRSGVGEEILSFIKGDEFDKRLTLDFGETVLCNPSERAGSRLEGEGTIGSVESSPTNKCLLVIDLRSIFQYQESHVRQSINLTNCPLVSKRIQDGKLQIKEYLEARVMFDGTQDVVIYEQGGCKDDCDSGEVHEDESEVTDFAKLIFLNLSKVKCDEARIEILRGGFDSFRKKYPKHCTQGQPFVTRFMFSNNVNDDEMAFLNWEASEIRKNIYVGALHDAQNDKLLDRLGITHILNCCKTNSRPVEEHVNDCSGKKYQYLQLMCEDNLKQTLDDKLEPAFTFIDAAVQTEGKVLIHCYAGISRSAAITIAYMMHKLNLSYEQSYSELKLKRSIVAPNINFVSQLMKFDEEKKRLALEKQQQVKRIQLAPAPSALKLNRVSGLASKRKMILPLPLKLDSNMKQAPVAASAPIMSPGYNPFAAAFKKANSNRCTEDIPSPFAPKVEILLE